MADPVFTASAIIPDLSGDIETGIAGASLAPPQAVYLDTVTKTFKLCNTTSATLAAYYGSVLNTASANQPVDVQKRGRITTNAVLVAGRGYWVSGTGGTHSGGAAGGLCLEADLTAGEQATFVGVAESTTILKIDPVVTGITRS